MVAQSCTGSTPCWKSQQEEPGQERSPRSGRRPGIMNVLCSSAVPGSLCIACLSAMGLAWPCVKSWSLIRLSCTRQLQLGKFPVGAVHPLLLCWAKRLKWLRCGGGGGPQASSQGTCSESGGDRGSPGQAAQRHPVPELNYIHPLPSPLPLLLYWS